MLRAGTVPELNSLHAGVVLPRAGAVYVLVDLHRDEVRGDGDHQPVSDDGQGADGL